MVNTGTPPYGVEFDQPFQLLPGNGLCVVHESEFSGNSYYPYVTFSWFE